MTELAGQRMLVVGGSSGIGLAIARQSDRARAAVTIASRSQAKLGEARAALGPDAEAAVLDAGDMTGVEAFFAERDVFDHIVVSAPQAATGPVPKLPLDDARWAVESKFWGANRIVRAARINERGSLTFITGNLADRPSAASVTQGAINAALDGLARGLALELSPIRVNTVSPGTIDTPPWSKLSDEARQAMFERVAATLPTKTVRQPDDIANAILFLMRTPFATGSTVRVDGGGVIA